MDWLARLLNKITTFLLDDAEKVKDKDETHYFSLEHNEDVVLYQVHHETNCQGEPCAIHNRTNHSLRDWPQNWRDDRGIIERVCPHGIGHPDPDQYEYWMRTNQPWQVIHGCDGCCTKKVGVVI